MFRATWNHFDTTFKSTLSNLQRHQQLVKNRAALVEYQNAKSARAQALKAYEHQEEYEMARRKTLLLSWLSAADSRIDQERGVDARRETPQSCQWLFGEDKFRAWADPLVTCSPLLWINGMPGAGELCLNF